MALSHRQIYAAPLGGWRSRRSASDGSTDRDWRSEQGNAIENITSTGVTELRPGPYRLTAVHYSGSLPIDFSVRVVRDGNSKTYPHRFTTERQEIEIDQFNIQ